MTTEVTTPTTTTTSSAPSLETPVTTPPVTTPTTPSPSTEVVAPSSNPTTPLATAIVDPAAAPAPVVTPPVEPVPAVTPPIEPAPTEDYDLELEESSPLTQADLDTIAQEASDRGLNKEQAQSLITQRESFFKKGIDSGQAKLDARFTKDSEAFNTDLDFVGEKRAESFASISRAAKAFGDEDFVKALSDPFIGHNLPLAKFLKKIGDAIGSDTIEGTGALKLDVETNTHMARLKNAYPEHFQD